MNRTITTYRIYAGGFIYHEDDFEEIDNSLPYYDDYQTIEIPDELIDHIANSGRPKPHKGPPGKEIKTGLFGSKETKESIRAREDYEVYMQGYRDGRK